MTGSNHIVAQVVTSVPAYCKGGVVTPAQWTACWKAGWNEPTTPITSYHLPGMISLNAILLAVIAVIVLLALASRRRTRRA
jgi:hypothetical protein